MKTVFYVLISSLFLSLLISCNDHAKDQPLQNEGQDATTQIATPAPTTEPTATPSPQVSTVDKEVDDFVQSVDSKLSSFTKEEKKEDLCGITEYIDNDDMVVKRIIECTDGEKKAYMAQVYYDYGRPQLTIINQKQHNAPIESEEMDNAKTKKLNVRVYIADGSLALKGTTVNEAGKIIDFPKELEDTWTQIMDFDE